MELAKYFPERNIYFKDLLYFNYRKLSTDW